MVRAEELAGRMKRNGSRRNVEGMKRFAITGSPLYGCSVPYVRKLAREVRREVKEGRARNAIARKLWRKGVHECKLLATMIAEPGIGWRGVERWISDCRNWAEVDQLCSNLLWKLKGVEAKALQYARARELWKKRTGFALMAVLAVRRKGGLGAGLVDGYLKAIERESTDERNFVRKAVNWALRQIGKSTNQKYWKKAVSLSKKLASSRNKTSRWVGSDARRELEAKGPRKP